MLLAVLVAGCTAGPSNRPAVAVRDVNLPPQRFQLTVPSNPPLPPVGDFYRNSLPWRDCTRLINVPPAVGNTRRAGCRDIPGEPPAGRPGLRESLQMEPAQIGQ